LPLTPAERLATSRLAWLVTVRPAGTPHTTPVWFVHEGAELWIGSPAASVKVRNVRARPQVSVAIDGTGAAPLVAEGTATVDGDLAGHPHVLEHFRRKYDGWDVSDESVDGPRVLVRITVVRWLLGGEP
jgi:PPOX class probable F420-dependent enzyme